MSKRQPTDATLRNVRASQRRDAVLREKVALLTLRVAALERVVSRLTKKRP